MPDAMRSVATLFAAVGHDAADLVAALVERFPADGGAVAVAVRRADGAIVVGGVPADAPEPGAVAFAAGVGAEPTPRAAFLRVRGGDGSGAARYIIGAVDADGVLVTMCDDAGGGPEPVDPDGVGSTSDEAASLADALGLHRP